MMRNLFRRATRALLPTLLCTAATAAAAPAAPALPDAEPAMWMVKDDDTTIYLFGTFHALDGKRDWFNDEVKQAFDASQDVVLEIVTPDDPRTLAPLFAKYGLDTSGRTLTSKLSPGGQEALAAKLAGLGMPINSLDSMKPFFASLVLTNLQFAKLGMGADHGVEAVLKKAAATSGKKLGAVETVEQQLSMMDQIGEAEHLRLLEGSLRSKVPIETQVGKLLTAWSEGDANTVAKSIQQSDKDSPLLYRLMFTERDARWVDWIDKRLEQPGTVFMAVGAGHLAGDRAVVAMLKKQGHRVTRVQ